MARERWPGGYVHKQKNGRPLFIIEREVRGHRFHVSTRTHTLRAAMKQLERFEADPSTYRPEGDEAELLIITVDLVKEFRKWSLEVKKNGKRHANTVSHRLAEWMDDLRGRDLRRLSIRDDIKPALEKRGNMRAYRIIALKSFCAWLRKEKGLLKTAEDATLDLPVPQGTPEKNRRRKAVAWEQVVGAASHLDQIYRDTLNVLLGTGMHFSELERFIKQPDSELVIPKEKTVTTDARPVKAVLVTRHKSGAWTRIPLTEASHVDAARRLREGGVVPKKPNVALREACDKAKVTRFTLGVMRHSVATWAIQRGATPEQVAEFLGHKDKRTTMKFYADVSVPTRSVPVHTLPSETLH